MVVVVVVWIVGTAQTEGYDWENQFPIKLEVMVRFSRYTSVLYVFMKVTVSLESSGNDLRL